MFFVVTAETQRAHGSTGSPRAGFLLAAHPEPESKDACSASPSKIALLGCPRPRRLCPNVILRSAATKNLLVLCCEVGKSKKQILHFVQDDSPWQDHEFHFRWASVRS